MFVKISTDNIMQKVQTRLVNHTGLPKSIVDTITNRAQQQLHDEVSADAEHYADALENEVADSIVSGITEKVGPLLSILKGMGEIQND